MSESPETTHATNTDDPAITLPGEILRAEREARGLSVHQVASELHVADSMLLALEKDDFDTIGAAIFVKGHLRNYARLLGLDPVPLLDAYDQHAHPAPPELVGRRPEGIPVQNDSGGPLLKIAGWIFVVILLLAAVGWWYYQQDSAQGVADRIDILVSPDDEISSAARQTDDAAMSEPAFADRLAAAEKAATTGRDDQEADPRATVAAVDENQPGSRPEPEDQAAAQDPEQVTDGHETASRDSGSRETGNTASRSTGSTGAQASGNDETRENMVRQPAEAAGEAGESGAGIATGTMQLEFTEASWAEVYNSAGDALLYDLVPAGTTRRLEAAGEVRVFLGNAPAVAITLNGDAFDTERYIRRDNTARFRIDLTPAE